MVQLRRVRDCDPFRSCSRSVRSHGISALEPHTALDMLREPVVTMKSVFICPPDFVQLSRNIFKHNPTISYPAPQRARSRVLCRAQDCRGSVWLRGVSVRCATISPYTTHVGLRFYRTTL